MGSVRPGASQGTVPISATQREVTAPSPIFPHATRQQPHSEMLRRNAGSVGAEERTGVGARRPRDRMAAGLHVPGARRRRPPPAQCRAAPGSGPQRSRAAAEPGPGRGESSRPARPGPPLGSPPAARGRERRGGEGKESGARARATPLCFFREPSGKRCEEQADAPRCRSRPRSPGGGRLRAPGGGRARSPRRGS